MRGIILETDRLILKPIILKNAKDVTGLVNKNVVKFFGVFIYPLMKDDCKYLCLFKSDKGIIVCCPVTFVSKNTFLIKQPPVKDWWNSGH